MFNLSKICYSPNSKYKWNISWNDTKLWMDFLIIRDMFTVLENLK